MVKKSLESKMKSENKTPGAKSAVHGHSLLQRPADFKHAHAGFLFIFPVCR
jgi:hypothetical protein